MKLSLTTRSGKKQVFVPCMLTGKYDMNANGVLNTIEVAIAGTYDYPAVWVEPVDVVDDQEVPYKPEEILKMLKGEK